MGDGDPMCTCNLQGQVQRGTPGEASRLSCSGGQFALTCSPQSGCCSQPVKGPLAIEIGLVLPEGSAGLGDDGSVPGPVV